MVLQSILAEGRQSILRFEHPAFGPAVGGCSVTLNSLWTSRVLGNPKQPLDQAFGLAFGPAVYSVIY